MRMVAAQSRLATGTQTRNRRSKKARLADSRPAAHLPMTGTDRCSWKPNPNSREEEQFTMRKHHAKRIKPIHQVLGTSLIAGAAAAAAVVVAPSATAAGAPGAPEPAS